MSAAAAKSTTAAARLAGLPKALALVAVGVLASIVALSIDTRLSYLLLYAWFGIGYGLLLQYGRFCMAIRGTRTANRSRTAEAMQKRPYCSSRP